MSSIQTINLNKADMKLTDTDDPIALKVGWTPTSSGGANFKTQKLTVKGHQIVVEKTLRMMIFSLFFVVPGVLAVIAGSPYVLLVKGSVLGAGFIFLWGLLFGGIGFLVLIGSKKVTFDQLAGVYYLGKKFDYANRPDLTRQGRFIDIHAIQILSKRVTSSDGDGDSYTNYELNLVLKSSDRIHVMNQVKQENILLCAQQLATVLNVPIWRGNG